MYLDKDNDHLELRYLVQVGPEMQVNRVTNAFYAWVHFPTQIVLWRRVPFFEFVLRIG